MKEMVFREQLKTKKAPKTGSKAMVSKKEAERGVMTKIFNYSKKIGDR